MKEEKDIYKCQKCGSPLTEEEDFCSKCGTKRGEKNNRKCKYCDAILEDDKKFCPKCGKKASFNINTLTPKKKLKKKTIIIMAISLIVVVALIITGIKVLPKLLISYSELLKEGNYEEAYKKANDKEKTTVCDENLVAYISKEIAENLKDPTSYLLRDAWYDKENSRIVLYTNGKNSYGASVSSYDYYTYDEDDNKWSLFTSLSSLSQERIYTYADSSSEKVEKILKNAARKVVSKIIDDSSLKIDDSSVENVNNLFKENRLKDVNLLSCAYPKDKTKNNA